MIARMVLEDSAAVSSRIPRTRADFLSKRRQSECDYPINIALQHNASLLVLKMLADTGPKILTEGDGPEWGSALSCALYRRRGVDVVFMLLTANPDQVHVRDRHLNYPLHIACCSGSSLSTIKILASRYRRALRKRNFHGLTPLDIAKRNALCSEDVIDYLQEVTFQTLETNAIHLDVIDNEDESGEKCADEGDWDDASFKDFLDEVDIEGESGEKCADKGDWNDASFKDFLDEIAG